MSNVCQHQELVLHVSDFGVSNGFQRASSAERAAATRTVSRGKKSAASKLKAVDPTVFPGPLVLPNDALTWEDENDPQSYDDFFHLEERNRVTEERKTIYLVRQPKIDHSISSMSDWTHPTGFRDGQRSTAPTDMFKGVFDYVSAFYHGLPVKEYTAPIKFARHGTSKSKTPSRIDALFDGLALDVRTRAGPDGVFTRQLNLNDLIDVLINILPDDAYAMIMLVDHDVWEDDEDDFTCGRAYGGSRVGVVSTARYNPLLDMKESWDGEHAWPASHCRDYANDLTAEFEAENGRPAAKKAKRYKSKKSTATKSKPEDATAVNNALRAAVNCYRDLHSTQKSSRTDTDALLMWLSRVGKTVSHELGHCFGIDHCAYYACVMQGTCGIQEDHRQPPYLCPVDLAKLLSSTGSDELQRDRALLRLLDRPAWRNEPTFAAHAAWIRSKNRIKQVASEPEPQPVTARATAATDPNSSDDSVVVID